MNTAKVMKERNGGNIPGVHSQILKEQPPPENLPSAQRENNK